MPPDLDVIQKDHYNLQDNPTKVGYRLRIGVNPAQGMETDAAGLEFDYSGMKVVDMEADIHACITGKN